LNRFFKRNKHYILKFFTQGHERSLAAKKNIAVSLIIQGTSILIAIVLVPITINYVDPIKYGIWLTLSSIITWFSFFDIGFGNGLRNKYTEAKANNDYPKAKSYVSTTYAILTIIFFSVWLLFFLANFFINWSKVLNTPPELKSEISTLALFIISFFCIQIVLKTINTILIADQKPAKAAFNELLSQIISLIAIVILTRTTKGSLLNLGLAIGIAPLIVFTSSSILFFKLKYKNIAPSFSHVDFSYAKDILSIGVKFFFIQIAAIIIYQTNNIIITHTSTPANVTVYNIAYKYMSVILLVFTIVINPFWSAFTDAYTKKDYYWMVKSVKNLRKLSYLVILGVIFLISISNFVYKLWIKDVVKIPFSVTVSLGIFIIVLCFVSLNTQILNGIGKIKIQLIAYSFATIFHIPLAIFLGEKFGIAGVVYSATFFCLIVAVFSIIQVNMLINKKAKGIWNE